jgi:hypothetical protein
MKIFISLGDSNFVSDFTGLQSVSAQKKLILIFTAAPREAKDVF